MHSKRRNNAWRRLQPRWVLGCDKEHKSPRSDANKTVNLSMAYQNYQSSSNLLGEALFAGVEHLRQLLALHTTCFTGSRLEAVEARLPRLPRLPGLCVHGRCQSHLVLAA